MALFRSRSANASRVSVSARPVALLASGLVVFAGGADGSGWRPILQRALRLGEIALNRFIAWYQATPATDRITTGGLAACVLLGGLVILGRSWRLRRRRVLPNDFMKRFKERLQEPKFDRGKALDLCELNPSPASRVALSVLRRWGRPTGDLDRAASMTARNEVEHLRRHVGTLRRIAALAPLIGLLGSLLSMNRALSEQGAQWSGAVGGALWPLTAGVALAILALVAYDGLMGRVEKLASALENLGSQTVDAVAMSMPIPQPSANPEPRPIADVRRHPAGPPRAPHQIRIDIPEHVARMPRHDEDDLYDL